MTWPTDRPGYPMHAERDGWHWLHHHEDLRPIPAMWNAELHGWACGLLHSPGGIVDLGYRYLGPCLTPTDLEAAVQAERAACAECVASFGDGAFGTKRAALAIRARGNTDALAALRAIAEETQA